MTEKLHILLVVIGIVISSTLILSAAFSVKYKKKLLYMAELNNLRDFLNLLYYASSEINVYEVIMDHILKQRIADRITLFYSQEDSGGDTAWNTLSRGSISFCNIPSSGCPLAENDAAFYVGNLKPCNLRICRYPELKKGSCTCIPVSHSESSYKFLQLYSRRKKTFTSIDICIIKSCIDIAEMIIRNNRVIDILSEEASTDNLTKTYNRNFIDPYLENLIKTTSLSNDSVSLIMADIDNFKIINDSFGHAVGDHVLSIFAGIIVKCVRKGDLIARYGGDEFIIVLPSTDIKTAQIIAERIRNEVAATEIPSINNLDISSLTCSIGISAYPMHCDSRENLIRSSDIALYNAKQSGKNCVKAYNSYLFQMQ